MSVINKVLRDLDQRAAAGEPAQAGAAAVPTGVVPVAPLPATGHREAARPRRIGWLLVLLLGFGVTALAVLWGREPAGPPAQVRDSVAQAPAAPMAGAPASAAVPAAAAAAVASAPVPAVIAEPAVAAVPVASAPALAVAPPPPPALQPPPALPPPVAAAPAPAVAQAASVPRDPPMRERPMAVAPPPEPAPLAQQAPPVPWTDAAMDAVGQAQRMWSAGGRDTALAFMRDALAGVERAHGAELVPERAGFAVGLAMVRELVRMEQVLANHAQVLALLQRHEALVLRQADLWAVRGSAAQRLSQHAEAADAYRTALRLRPGEPRWMLGAAVSLAAQGQLAPAAQWLEQARAIGPVSPDVMSYLRQMGVAIQGDNSRN